ncbi:uncharacterized protein CANTADRAFT_326440 [Suhomyces tanzawaensis NRRL Y-17324]|uniref:Uncharacterized protein n=1 Tax=Suhomyces tanzawaensis NRRL Y-17324 TaxID=984487 RepID=A0A1E4SC54_9ASCO|nr:uncharacterized protein CANTADRAFT_326440 [Suhomyces tanzawaensis NRRL Y-17324]ODV77104.1 hypothetical protein CANTADRAFT_326440 [Suhomyces tanzawaensis NRRL Y-17324]
MSTAPAHTPAEFAEMTCDCPVSSRVLVGRAMPGHPVFLYVTAIKACPFRGPKVLIFWRRRRRARHNRISCMMFMVRRTRV